MSAHIYIIYRKQFPTDDPEWEEMQKQKQRAKRREEDLEMLHSSMFGWLNSRLLLILMKCWTLWSSSYLGIHQYSALPVTSIFSII